MSEQNTHGSDDHRNPIIRNFMSFIRWFVLIFAMYIAAILPASAILICGTYITGFLIGLASVFARRKALVVDDRWYERSEELKWFSRNILAASVVLLFKATKLNIVPSWSGLVIVVCYFIAIAFMPEAINGPDDKPEYLADIKDNKKSFVTSLLFTALAGFMNWLISLFAQLNVK